MMPRTKFEQYWLSKSSQHANFLKETCVYALYFDHINPHSINCLSIDYINNILITFLHPFFMWIYSNHNTQHLNTAVSLIYT